MKITALEEYGLRCLLQIARVWEGDISISEIAKKEGLSVQYVSKLTALLRSKGLIESTRGAKGGYRLAVAPGEITLAKVSQALGHPMFDTDFCGEHAGVSASCVHESDCSVRSVWSALYMHMNSVMEKITLLQLLKDEKKVQLQVVGILDEVKRNAVTS